MSDIAFAAVLWGDKYSPADVTRLAKSLARHADRALPFVCVTDWSADFGPDVEVRPARAGLPGWWQKLAVFDRDLVGYRHVVYCDLDVVVMASLESVLTRVRERPLVHAQDLLDPMSSSFMIIDTESELASAATHGAGGQRWQHAMQHDLAHGFGPQGYAPSSGEQKYLAELIAKRPSEEAAPLLCTDHYSYKYLVDHGEWRTRATNPAYRPEPPSAVTMLNFHGHPKPRDVIAAPHEWPLSALVREHY